MAKENRVYDDFEINFSLNKDTRKALKDSTVNEFLKEKKGYWEGDTKHVTRYKYYVETLEDGRRVFLLRPTFLNKGIDFQVWVEKFDGDEDKRPSHKDVFLDLNKKKSESPKKIAKLLKLIDKVGVCEDPDSVLKNNKLEFDNGWSVEMLLKILKWLFIEQDITYWNYDGREMLLRAIKSQLK